MAVPVRRARPAAPVGSRAGPSGIAGPGPAGTGSCGARVPTRAALFGSDGAARLNIDLKRRTIYCQRANNSRSKFASAEARRSRCVRESDARTAADKRVRVPLRARESHEPQRVLASCSAGGRASRVTGKGVRTPAATRVRLLLELECRPFVGPVRQARHDLGARAGPGFVRLSEANRASGS